MSPESNTQHESLWQGLTSAGQGLRADVERLATARWQLARLEGQLALDAARRLATALAIGAAMLVIAATLTLTVVGPWIDRHAELPPGRSLAVAIGVLAVGGGGLMVVHMRQFRREFVGFRDTLAECQEDLAWMREWLVQADEPRSPRAG